MATKGRKPRTQTRGRKVVETPDRKDSPLDRKVHKRILQLFDDARAPEDLTELHPNFFPEIQAPGLARALIHDPAPADDPVPLIDFDTAEQLLSERDRISPIHGFSHFDQIGQFLDTSILKRIIPRLTHHFGSSTRGEWTTHGNVTIAGQTIVPRHAALLRTGNVIMFEGACADVPSRTWLWNPYSRTMVTPAPALPAGKFNLYCSGHSFLRDGELLARGGGGEWNTPGPKNAAWIFDPGTSSWDYTKDAVSSVRTWGKEERWYPTVVTLGDHRVLVASGSIPHLNCGTATTPPAMKMEIYDEVSGRFEYVTTPADKFFRPTYPGLHLLPNNQIFFAPAGYRSGSELPGACAGNEPSSLLSLTGLNGNWNDIGVNDRTKGMSALLLRNSPPYVRVIVVGGGDSGTSRTYAMAELSTPTSSWGSDLPLPLYGTQTQPTQRIHANVVLLPDGTVFVAGGAPVTEPCWLYDPNPANPGWSQMDELNFQRRYHSFALLLPTAEVMACGGQSTAGQSTIEVFRPPYLFKGPQPNIASVSPEPIHHGQNFTITTPNAASVSRVALVRPMAVTHQTDSEQRVIELSWAPATASTITATAPSPTDPHGLTPQGWYMLFIIDNNGVPSQAKFIHLAGPGPPSLLTMIQGDNQAVVVGEVAAEPLVVEAQDDAGGAVAGVQVVFAVTQGSATFASNAAVMTDSEGRARVFVQAGNQLGTNRVVASAVGRTVAFTLTTTARVPVVSSLGFVDGASFRPGWVSGSLGSIFGVGLMEGVTGVVEAGQTPFPTTLRGVRVIVNDVDAPILSLANVKGQEQINIQVPFGLSAPITVTIDNNGSRATFTGVPLFTVKPGIFEISVGGERIAAALHSDFSLMTPSNPARPREIILLFLTGLGPADPPVGTNDLGPVPPARSTVEPVVGIDNEGVEVLGSFYAPGLLTVYQINFRVPSDAPPGNRKLSVVAAGAASQDVLIPIGR